MSHEMTDYDQMFSVRERPWHFGQTNSQVLDEYPGREEAIRLAGHDFEVETQPVFVQTPEGTYVPLSDWERRVNSKTGEEFTVGPSSYVSVENTVGWDIAETVLGGDNVRYETAGTLKSGAVCWVLARLDEPSVVKGDDSAIYPFIAVSWGHDGSMAMKARATNVRVVCWNTLSMAESEGARSGREFTFRHTKNVMSRIEEAKVLLRGAREENQAFLELANELADIPVSDKGVQAFINEFIPEPAADVISNRVRTNIDTARGELAGILNGGLTITQANRNSAYGLVQAGVEYLDHVRGFRNQDTYTKRTILRDEGLKAKLIPTARRIAEEFPVGV